MKLSSLQLAAPPSGKFCGSVPFIVDISVKFNGDGTVNFYNNVKVAKQVIDCKAEAVTITGSDIIFTNIQKTGDCMGDALRSQKKDVTKFTLSMNSDGTLTFHSTWPDLKMKPCSSQGDNTVTVYTKPSSLQLAAPPSGKFCGSVPFIVDISVTFNGDG